MADIGAIRDLIEAERARFAVPGVAVAVVHAGRVVLCEGFGHADLEAGRPVGVSTRFPLASDTKAFTAAALCLLAESGLVDLDAPVREVLPWFAMDDPHATALVTPRDLLSHRTGLPRHDLVWYGDNAMSLEETTRRLRHLPMSRPLRTAWDYNNLCYIAAGYLTEVLAGMPWHEAVSTHLLRPLGMSNTVFSVQDAGLGQVAQPYKATAGGFARQALPSKATADKAGPAGGIVSSVADLAQWLLARLGRRTDVLPGSTLEQLHRPAMLGGIAVDRFAEIASLGYGLGCQVESYRGQRIVHHGGNIPGFSSDVCVVPGADIGIAVLTNLDSSYLRLPLMYGIIDLVSGNGDAGLGARIHELQTTLSAGYAQARDHQHARASAAPPSRPLDGFAGTYTHPAYGELTIRVEGDTLVPDFHDAGDRVRLAHRGHDAWDLVLVDYEVDCPLVFTQGMDGDDLRPGGIDGALGRAGRLHPSPRARPGRAAGGDGRQLPDGPDHPGHPAARGGTRRELRPPRRPGPRRRGRHDVQLSRHPRHRRHRRAGLRRRRGADHRRPGRHLRPRGIVNQEKFQARLTELAAKHHVVGASLAVAVGDETATAAAGVLNARTGAPVTADSVFQIGSITKVWTATLVMQLVDQGLVDLDAPLTGYLPDFRVLDEQITSSVTARHLLDHTSGIGGDFFPDTGRGDDCVARYVAEMSGLGASHPLGATMSYANSGFVLLGRLVEVVTGRSWDTVLRERLFAPLGLEAAGTLPEEALLWGAAAGHFGTEVTPQWGLPRAIGPAGLIHARAVDLLAFARLHLADGVAADGRRVLSADAARAMREPQAAIPEPWTSGSHVGLGWMLSDWAGRSSATTGRRSGRPPTCRSSRVLCRSRSRC